MRAILLKNIALDGSQKDILIKDGIIADICAPEGAGADITPDAEIVDCRGKAAFPGFINMHTHAGMALMRGMQEDVNFQVWIDNVWKMEKGIDPDFIYWSTKAAALEMIKTGTTTFNDQYWFIPDAHRAVAEMGIRPVFSYVFLDGGDASKAERQKDECLSLYEQSLSWKDDAKLIVTFHAVYSVSEELIVWAAEFARKHNLLLHAHLSETRSEVENCKASHGGLSPVEYLDRLGILGPDLIAAHTLWLSDNDIRLLGEHKVNCVHNINSNLKLASGYQFKYQELRDAGANVCLGTDGCASSNNLDMLEAMKTSAIVQKAWRDDPTAMPLEELAAAATINGARALHLNTGEIAVGKRADILIVDTDNSFFLSPAPFLANFVYSAHSDCIDSVIAGGRFVMKHRIVTGEKEILEGARTVLYKIKP